jgi:hypothetical protein
MKASCALTCGTCEDILEPILNKKSNNEQPEIVSSTASTEVEEQATSVENTSESKAETENVSENSEETAVTTKISDNENLTEEIEQTETGSSEYETIEIDNSVTSDNAKSEESSVSITVVTTESSVEDKVENHDENDGEDHTGHSHNNNTKSGTEVVGWSVLVFVLTFLVL